MKRVDARRSRQNRFPEYFFGDFQDFLLDRKDRDARQRLEAALSKAGITISRFIEHVPLIVSSGVGKTHLAIALGLAASGQGRKVRFFRVTELITLLMEAKEEKQLLFDVRSTAYERQSLILTTNLPFKQWAEVLGSERLTGAALDRLTHRCHILEAKGESFRLRDARRRQRRATGPS
ncbi:MAG: ATP-binding protein [Planctomycetota bacterium]